MFRPGSRVFWFVSVLRFCFVFVRPAFTFTTFHVGFAGYFLNSYVVCRAVNVFAPFVGFVGYIWFSMLFALLLNVCLLFAWALRAVSFPYVLCPAVNDLPFLWGLRIIISFALLFALLLNVCPLLMWALRVILISYVV